MKKAGRLFGGVLLVWVGSWLSLGCLFGEPLLLLHPLQAPEWLRVTYLILLYGGLLWLLSYLWNTYPPRGAGWGRARDWWPLWALSLGFALVQRGVLALGGHWHMPDLGGLSTAAGLSALFLAPALAVVEEAVFRGYLYGSLREQYSRPRAALMVSFLFALVHLFRPGQLVFKVAYGIGLMLASAVLIVAVERRGVWGASAVHSAWITLAVVDPPERMVPSWWSGLRGEPAAGVCSWLLLLALAGSIALLFKSREHAKSDSVSLL